jgi:hypothetical protein
VYERLDLLYDSPWCQEMRVKKRNVGKATTDSEQADAQGYGPDARQRKKERLRSASKASLFYQDQTLKLIKALGDRKGAV